MNDASSLSALLSQAQAALARRDAVQVNTLIRQVLTLDPENADALYLLGLNASTMNRPDLAINLLGKAIERNPARPHYHFNLGACLSAAGRLDEAEQCLLTALRLQPNLAEAHINLGNLRLDQGKMAEAVECYLRGVRLNPNLKNGYHNLGVIVQGLGDHEAALSYFQEALRCDPESAISHMGRAASLLKTGRFREGWQEYEWRFRVPNHSPRICPVPRWDGSDPSGLRLYVYTEQGFGDALMFARFAPVIRERGGIVLMECRPELERLFAASPLADRISSRALDDADPPPFDYDRHIPLMSLPLLLGTTLESLPAQVPYLTPPAERVRAWAERLGPKTGLRVGLSWSGNPEASVNRERACALHHLLPVTLVPNITFYSLQKGPPAAQLTDALQRRHEIIPLAEELHDFTETAAALLNLDLLISTDTAIVHLAGGLGVPVWTLLHTSCEWRWLDGREDCPWYPSMRLFRQRQPGDWHELAERTRRALSELPSTGSRGH
ncbi:MAG: tetratricopeptide repeat protein [Magnetococcales bacterium]|nr:tetratricopeptide repeat protein [Magnetococcales bacterium]